MSAPPHRPVPAPIAHALALYRSKLAAVFGLRFRDLRLYGSWARGEQGPESDVDLLVLIKGMTN